jgi:hypothetical protein
MGLKGLTGRNDTIPTKLFRAFPALLALDSPRSKASGSELVTPRHSLMGCQ